MKWSLGGRIVLFLLGASGACSAAEISAPASTSNAASAPSVQTGFWRGRSVTYIEVGGRKVFEGDILLDQVTPAPAPAGPSRSSLAIDESRYLWTKNGAGLATIPYVITQGSTNLTNALGQFNAGFSGVIQFSPRNGETAYVNIILDPADFSGVCQADEGMGGAEQFIRGSGACTVATLLHEMGHALGLLHEHTRPDRDSFVAVNYGAIIKASRGNFDKQTYNYQDLGLYDYASVMEYPAESFSRNGLSPIETIPSGMPLSNSVGYSAGDIDAVLRLYGAAPTGVTFTTNPVGLPIIVDGKKYTSPQTFSGAAWALNTTHQIGAPGGAQALAGSEYVFGRWSDSLPASHNIMIAPGSGALASPRTAPAITVYCANFRQLVNFTATVNPTGAGTIAAKPAALAFANAPGVYYFARQRVTLTAQANAGYGFLYWSSTSSPYISAPWSANPKVEPAPGNIVANFSNQPITTITTIPPGHWFTVDGVGWKGPQNFASDFFPSWTAGSAHAVGVPTPQLPYSVNSRYKFASWSDGLGNAHSYAVPATSATLSARLTSQFRPAAGVNPICAASVTLSPPSPAGDGFYNSGKTVSFAAAPVAGFTLTGWLYDLAGTAPTQSLVIADEEYAVANYDATPTAILIASLSPSALPAGSPSATLAIAGAGFTPSTLAYVNGFYRSSTYVGPQQINLDLTAADLATPGAFAISVGNFPVVGCGSYVSHDFTVITP